MYIYNIVVLCAMLHTKRSTPLILNRCITYINLLTTIIIHSSTDQKKSLDPILVLTLLIKQ